MIWNVLALSGLRLLFRLGLAPSSVLIRRSLKALHRDDLTGAVNAYFEAARRDFSSDKVAVLREILISEIKFRKQILVERVARLESLSFGERKAVGDEIEACRQARGLLDDYLRRLGAQNDDDAQSIADRSKPI